MSGRKINIMKIRKEIKPFKMRVSESQSKKVQEIALFNGYELSDMWLNHDFLVLSSDTLYSYHGKYLNLSAEPEPELTYSEFMKLYGEEDEVFTREDMRCLCAYLQNKFDCEHWSGFDSSELINDFLSERTND